MEKDMQEFNINKEKYNKKHVNLLKDVFYRPSHPLLNKKPGWVARWQLVYKKMFASKLLYSQEEVFESEEEAKQALKKHTLKELLTNIKEFLSEET